LIFPEWEPEIRILAAMIQPISHKARCWTAVRVDDLFDRGSENYFRRDGKLA